MAQGSLTQRTSTYVPLCAKLETLGSIQRRSDKPTVDESEPSAGQVIEWIDARDIVERLIRVHGFPQGSNKECSSRWSQPEEHIHQAQGSLRCCKLRSINVYGKYLVGKKQRRS